MYQRLILSSTSVNTAGRATLITGIADQLVSETYLAGDGSRYRHSMLRRLQRVPGIRQWYPNLLCMTYAQVGLCLSHLFLLSPNQRISSIEDNRDNLVLTPESTRTECDMSGMPG